MVEAPDIVLAQTVIAVQPSCCFDRSIAHRPRGLVIATRSRFESIEVRQRAAFQGFETVESHRTESKRRRGRDIVRDGPLRGAS